MTQDNSSQATPDTETGSGDLFNTAAGWVLFAAGLGLGLSILSGKYFHADNPERPETLGYVIEGVEEEGGDSGPSLVEVLNMVTAEDGERVFAKCQACHTMEQGGANGVGPNLYGVMGAAKAGKSGFGYSTALSGFGGNWGWEEMDAWLNNPRGYVDGTTMGFAGISSMEDRAAVAVYMNANGGSLTVPEFVAEEPAEEEAEEVVEGDAEDAQNAAEETSEETEAAE